MVHIYGITTIIFGIASLLMISRARRRLTAGSVRKYLDNFAVCLAFIVTFSVWQTVRYFFEAAQLEEHTNYLTYPEYIFIALAYVAFIVASYRAYAISREFGFREDGERIAQIIKEKPGSKNIGYKKTKGGRVKAQ